MKAYACTQDVAGRFGKEDIRKSYIWAALAYFIFFIPIIICPDNRFARYHANQSLILLVMMTFGITLVSMVPYIGILLTVIGLLLGVVCIVRGFYLAITKKAKPIPLIGRLELIAYEPKA